MILLRIFLILIAFLVTKSKIHAHDFSSIKFGGSYGKLFKELHNHFEDPIIYSIESSILDDNFERVSFPLGLSFSTLYSDDVHKAFKLSTYTLSGGGSYEFRHTPWYRTIISTSIDATFSQLKKNHAQIQLQESNNFLIGLSSEIEQMININEKWAGIFSIKYSNQEIFVENIFVSFGVKIAYNI